MIDLFHKIYRARNCSFARVTTRRWISLSYSLTPENCAVPENEVTLKMASDKDIREIENHPEANENILKSVLSFWHNYGIHSLYLGYFNYEQEPSILQYVLGHECNNIYRIMPYGSMYRHHSYISVQVENIYHFKCKRKRNYAKRFEMALFKLLFNKGKRIVRTHISVSNEAALLWASQIGFYPEYWISMLQINLPFLRKMKPSFLFQPIKYHEWDIYPLKIFKKQNKESNKNIKYEYPDRIFIPAS